LEEFITVIEGSGIRVETVRAGEPDFSTPTGGLCVTMRPSWFARRPGG
jgi:hypothetical protein